MGRGESASVRLRMFWLCSLTAGDAGMKKMGGGNPIRLSLS